MAGEWITGYYNLFKAREDVYAEGYPRPDGSGKYLYRPARDGDKDKPLTEAVVRQHLKGEIQVGVYPILADDTVNWIAIDFDAGDDPIHDAFEQVQKLRSLGLFSYVERSRSGTGAHVWAFFDEPVPAFKARRVILSNLVDSVSYDMVFPNQDSARGNYGNLIALPYNGRFYQDNESGFVNQDRVLIRPQDFLATVRKNRSILIHVAYDALPPAIRMPAVGKARNLAQQSQPVPGALKVCHFCTWVRDCREKLPLQNQEPRLYSLACQFARLEGGEPLLQEYAALHPYDPKRVQDKWDRAVRENKPETCVTLREKYGDCGKRCDRDILTVSHPFDLAKQPYHLLHTTEKSAPEAFADVAVRVVDRAKRVARHEEDAGWAYGWDIVDGLTELRRGDLIIMASRPSIGKSAAMIDMAANLADRGVPSYCISLEMTKEQLVQRMLARRSHIDASLIDRGVMDFREWRKVIKTSRTPIPFFVDDKTRSLDQIVEVLGNMIHQSGPGVAFVDYLQLLKREQNESETQALDRSVLGLQAVAKLLNIPIIGMSQLNRSAEMDERDGEDPIDSWLRGSDTLATAPDVIMFLRGRKAEGVVDRVLRIHKERHRGIAGIEVDMKLHQSVFRFESIRIRRRREFSVAEDAGDSYDLLS